MPSGICSRRADFAGAVTSGLLASFTPSVPGLVDCPRAPGARVRRRYAMAAVRPAFPDGMTGQPIWSLQAGESIRRATFQHLWRPSYIFLHLTVRWTAV